MRLSLLVVLVSFLTVPAHAQDASAPAYSAEGYDGHALPPDELLPPANEHGYRVISKKRRELWEAYDRQSYALPILLIVGGGVTTLLSVSNVSSPSGCLDETCRRDRTDENAQYYLTGALGIGISTAGIVWLGARINKRGEIRSQIERLNARERFTVEQLSVTPQATPDGRGAGVMLTGTF